MTFEPLIWSKVILPSELESDDDRTLFYPDDVLSALEGYRAYLRKRAVEFANKNSSMSFAFADAEVILEEWFPILQSLSGDGMTTPETVVPTDVIAVHGDVAEERSIDSLKKQTSLDGSEQTSTLISLWDAGRISEFEMKSIMFETNTLSKYELDDYNQMRANVGLACVSFSQPFNRNAQSLTKDGCSQSGYAGELLDAERSCPATGMSNVKQAPRKRRGKEQ